MTFCDVPSELGQPELHSVPGGAIEMSWLCKIGIEDVPMKCQSCGTVSRLGDCEPDVDGDGSLGCPLPDCGGIAKELAPYQVEGKK